MMRHWLRDGMIQWLLARGRRMTRQPTFRYLSDFAIDCVFDVGANVGQFARELRSIGYRQRIESFEPLPNAFAQLERAAASDPLWAVHPYALGSDTASRLMNVSTHSPSSSFLEMEQSTGRPTSEFETVCQAPVIVKRLNDVFMRIRGQARCVYLKIDTQGFERQVLEGGAEVLPEVALVQMELSLVANYHGESLIEDLIAYMRSHSFDPWWIIDGFRNPQTLQLYQADVIFVNRRHSKSQNRDCIPEHRL